MSVPKKRLDQLVFDRGLADSRSKAQALVMAGEILVNGKKATKAGHQTKEDVLIELLSTGPRYVSRGGIKLAGALEHFGIDPTGWNCLDVGASTGGFTDCLLQRGAKNVFTLDVGKGQLDPKIRNDSRVGWSESFHIKDLTPDHIPELVDLATVDVSFISLTKVLPHVVACIRNGGTLLALIKPQFEAEKRDVLKGGVLKDEAKRQEIIQSLCEYSAKCLSLEVVGTVDSVITGPKGNQETFLYAK